MSQIFDALQRAEAERSGGPSLDLLQATEILRRAEKEEVSKWGKEGDPGQSRPSQSDDQGRTLESLGISQVSAPSVTPFTGDRQAVAQSTGSFSQIQAFNPPLSTQSRLVTLTDQDGAAAEAFRLLVVRLTELRRTRPLKKIMVTSTIPQEGKSMVAANLACTFARGQKQKVLLLEGDVRRPGLSEIFGLKNETGLCEWLHGECNLSKSIYHLEEPNIWILPAGSSPDNPLELLRTGRLSALMAQLAEWFDQIVIDTPPVLPMADTSIWMRLAEGILLVTRQGTTEKKQLQKGLEALDSSKLIGALLNCSENMAHSDYYYRN